MLLTIGGFKAEFSGQGKFYHLPRKQRTPTSGGKLVGVQVCGGEDMRPDLAFSSTKWKPRKNRLLKMPQDAFSVGAAINLPCFNVLVEKRNSVPECSSRKLAELT